MAQDKNLTPEKQLLNMIERPRGKAPGPKAAARTAGRYGKSIFSLGALKGRFSFFKSKYGSKKGAAFGISLNIRTLNRAEAVIILALTGYLAANLSFLVKDSKIRLASLESKIKKGSQQSAGAVNMSGGNIAKHLDAIRSRDIFKMGYKKSETKVNAEEASSRIIDATKHLKLVGISWSNDPDAMVEDTKAVRTFFVKRGQVIGDVKVESILKDKLILSFEGEEVELK